MLLLLTLAVVVLNVESFTELTLLTKSARDLSSRETHTVSRALGQPTIAPRIRPTVYSKAPRPCCPALFTPQSTPFGTLRCHSTTRPEMAIRYEVG